MRHLGPVPPSPELPWLCWGWSYRQAGDPYAVGTWAVVEGVVWESGGCTEAPLTPPLPPQVPAGQCPGTAVLSGTQQLPPGPLQWLRCPPQAPQGPLGPQG